MVYEFRYSVDDLRSGVVNDRWEQRVGQFVKGSYSLLEPSGMIRTVNYEVDGRRGFVAVVRTHYPGEWTPPCMYARVRTGSSLWVRKKYKKEKKGKTKGG